MVVNDWVKVEPAHPSFSGWSDSLQLEHVLGATEQLLQQSCPRSRQQSTSEHTPLRSSLNGERQLWKHRHCKVTAHNPHSFQASARRSSTWSWSFLFQFLVIVVVNIFFPLLKPILVYEAKPTASRNSVQEAQKHSQPIYSDKLFHHS